MGIEGPEEGLGSGGGGVAFGGSTAGDDASLEPSAVSFMLALGLGLDFEAGALKLGLASDLGLGVGGGNGGVVAASGLPCREVMMLYCVHMTPNF